MDALNNATNRTARRAGATRWCLGELAEHEAHVLEPMEDLPEVRGRRAGG